MKTTTRYPTMKGNEPMNAEQETQYITHVVTIETAAGRHESARHYAKQLPVITPERCKEFAADMNTRADEFNAKIASFHEAHAEYILNATIDREQQENGDTGTSYAELMQWEAEAEKQWRETPQGKEMARYVFTPEA